MKIVYSSKLEEDYPTNPVESPERIRLAAEELKGYEFVEPAHASLVDISKIHGSEHIERVRRRGLFEPASLAAGGAILAAEHALLGEAAFALVRPPGHHASRLRSWGMCFFNNIAIAVERIRRRAGRVLILDLDLHYGDGTVNIFRGLRDVRVVNIGAVDLGFEYLNLDISRYIEEVASALKFNDYDIVAVSAGFDTYIEDWGKMLTNEDFFRVGRVIREGSEDGCDGKRFAVLEGGYHSNLRYNIKSFIDGFS